MNLPNLFKSQPETFNVALVKYKKPIDEQLINKLTDYIKSFYQDLLKMGFSKIMVGVSGDTNSLLAGALVKQALGENMIVMVIDLGTANANSLVDSCQKLALNSYILKRGAAYQAEVSAYRLHKEVDIQHFSKRFINYHLLIQADHFKAALVDIIDKSDRLLGIRPEGFYGHLMPFYSLYKSELLDLAEFLGIPPQFIVSNPNQRLSYPGNIPLAWDQIDPVLFLLNEKQISLEEISRQYNIDFSWLKKLRSRLEKQSLKTVVSQAII